MNSKYEEYQWWLDIVTDIKRNYPQHNKDVTREIAEHLNYKLESLGCNNERK